MGKPTNLFILLLLIAWILFGAWYINKNFCNASAPAAAITEEPTSEPEKLTSSTWTIADGNAFTTKSSDYFGFAESGFEHTQPLGEGLTASIGKVADYLKGNPERALTITGLYQEGEENTSVLPDLGMARANNIKAFLVSLGVPSNQLALGSRMLDNGSIKDGFLANGIDFGFAEAESGTSRLDAIKARLLGKPITLYFETNVTSINLSAQQRTDFADLVYYLDNVENAKLDIDGHTDSVGEEKLNQRLSRKRAEFVSGYLTKNGGISSNRMVAQGFGPNKPVASNDTPEGKAKNRRVEVTLR